LPIINFHPDFAQAEPMEDIFLYWRFNENAATHGNQKNLNETKALFYYPNLCTKKVKKKKKIPSLKWLRASNDNGSQ
jgi:hypothetical protein